MSDYHKQFPTQGDLAREQLRRRGFLYFGDVQKDLAVKLESADPAKRKSFALGCALRAMERHLALPIDEQRPFTLSLRPLLSEIQKALAGEASNATELAISHINALKAAEEASEEDPDALEEYDEDAAAAALYAAECFINGDVSSAKAASSRAIDSVYVVAANELQLNSTTFSWDPDADPMPLALEAMHPAVQDELKSQLAGAN